MPKAHRRLMFGLVLLVLLLLSQELALRLLFPVPEALHFSRLHYSDLFVAPELGSRPRVAKRSFVWASDPDEVESLQRLNLYGFRDRTWSLSPPSDRSRVMMVGDSFVEGFTADEQQTLPRQIERLARAEGRQLELMNLGVAAAGIPQYLRLIRDAVPLFRPEQVLLVIYANDLPAKPSDQIWQQAAPEAVYSSAWTPRLAFVVGRLIQGKPVPRAFVEQPFPFLAAVPDPSNPWSNPEFEQRFGAFVRAPIADAMKAGRFNPHVVNEDRFYRTRLQQPAKPESFLRPLRQFLEDQGVDLLLVYLPSRGQISDHYAAYQAEYCVARTVASIRAAEFQRHAAALAHSCRELELAFLDLTPAMRDREDAGQRLYWNYDEHLNPQGYALVAELMHAWWSGHD